MADKPWTEHEVVDVGNLIGNQNPWVSNQYKIATEILSLLHARGLLKEKQ